MVLLLFSEVFAIGLSTEASGAKEEAPVGQAFVFWGGLAGMIFVPVFSALTQCPAWLLGIQVASLGEVNARLMPNIIGASFRAQHGPRTIFANMIAQ